MATKNIKIAPSILSADFARMGQEVECLQNAGADLIHCDVMDGSFVPNLTMGPKMIADIRRHTKLPLDVHLMIVEPIRHVDAFIQAGADIVTVHMEVSPSCDPTECIKRIKASGARCGVVLNPKTPHEIISDEILAACDMVLLMSVNPGFGGQSFIAPVMQKIRALRARIDALGLVTDLEIDGGVTLQNAPEIRAAGANVLVAGNTVFSATDRAAAIRTLRGV